MQTILKLYFRHYTKLKIGIYFITLMVTASILSIIIVQGLNKDHKLLELLPPLLHNLSSITQIQIVLYEFIIVFLRAGILLLEGFLGYQIVARALISRQIQQLVASPITRLQIYGGMMLTIIIIAGGLLLIVHGLLWINLYILGQEQLPFTWWHFAVLDWSLDIFIVISGLLPSAIALWWPKVGIIISSSLFLVVIFCNLTILSYQTTQLTLFAALLLAITGSCLLVIYLSSLRFKKQDL